MAKFMLMFVALIGEVKLIGANESFYRNYTIMTSSPLSEMLTYVRYKVCMTSPPRDVTPEVSTKNASLPHTFTVAVLEVLKPGVILRIKRDDTKAGWSDVEVVVTLLLMNTNSCDDEYEAGSREDGVYQIKVNDNSVIVYCDMATPNGGWTVFQRRVSSAVDFYRPWADYENGFGNINNDYWMGLKYLHELTKNGNHRLRVDMTMCNRSKAFAEFSNFAVGGADTNYTLTLDGHETFSTAGDSFTHHNGMQFSTYERDNDIHDSKNCAAAFKGGWWFVYCMSANLNGLFSPCAIGGKYIHWKALDTTSLGSLSWLEIKFKSN
ncbi:microfibril-associated glycoprotein 4-like [Ciona intestinalis]